MVEDRNKSGSACEKDPLTGLISRQEFLQKVDNVIKGNKSCTACDNHTLVYFNLLNFKLINLTFGTDAGDDCVRQLAEILKKYFKESFLTRLSDNHFIALTERKDVIETIPLIYKECSDANLQVNIGIRHIDESIPENNAAGVCDQAKIACDSIKKGTGRFFAIYNDEIRQNLERDTYITENLDDAIRKGCIQIYFQPILRSLTGKVCGMEALTRWVDSDRGIMSPNIFIPVLERAHLVHKLDAYVLNEVGSILSQSIKEGYPMIPVSINLSHSDFVFSDPFHELETVVKKYKLHRDFFCIEITESVLMSRKAHFLEEIRKFREAGYRVSMDDFGSSYSSLNALREIEFDELKLDLCFVKNLDEKGKQIIRTIIDMAKELQIHTLAEGVENEEQVTFLRETGCEKIQGFYYGRPQPMEEFRKNLASKNIHVESPAESRMYDAVGFLNILTEKPTAIFLSRGDEVRILLANPAYKKVLESIGGREEKELNTVLEKPNFALHNLFRDFTQKVISSHEENTLYYVDNGKDLRLTAQCIASAGDEYLMKASLENITYQKNPNEYRSVDSIVRNIKIMYMAIFQIEYHRDRIYVLSASHQPDAVGKSYYDIRATIDRVARHVVYPDDREHFKNFMMQFCTESFYKEGAAAYTDGWFRYRNSGGNYTWMEHSAIILKDEEYSALICIKEASIENAMDKKAVLSFLATQVDEMNDDPALARVTVKNPEKDLWAALMEHTIINYFWKDRKGRFLGASKSFLEYFGIASVDEIIGKTAEEMGLLRDEQAHRNEQYVLEKGDVIRDAVEICVAHGMVRDINVNRFPVYHDGKITSFLGYFYDSELFSLYDIKQKEAETKDALTGLHNVFGFVLNGNRLFESCRLNQKDMLVLILDIPMLREFYQRYGAEEAQPMIREVAMGLKKLTDQNTILCRIDSIRFIFMKQADARKEGKILETRIKEYIESIRTLHGYKCTLFPYVARNTLPVQEFESFDRIVTHLMLEIARREEMQEVENRKRIFIDLGKLNELDETIYICDPESCELFFMNAKGLADLGLPSNYPYYGKTCYEVFEHRKTPCDGCTTGLLRRNHIFRRNYHSTLNGNDYMMRDTLISWNERTARLTMGVNVSDYTRSVSDKDEILNEEITANDAISIALEEVDANEGIRKLLAKIGGYMNAEKAFIYEVNGCGTFRNTYIWDAHGNETLFSDLPEDISEILLEIFAYAAEFKIERLENIREDMPTMYAYLKENGVKSAIALPLRNRGRIIGYVGIVNPEKKAFVSANVFFGTLTRFLSILLRNRDMVHKLDVISHRDALTGVMNRRAYIEESTHRLYRPTAILFADVNGLKQVNDTLGHEEGDKLIRSVANVMSALFGTESVYRLGGDEFLIIEETPDRAGAEALVKKLKEGFERENLSVAIGLEFSNGDGEEIDQLVKAADEQMYRIKEMMHREMKRKS